MATAPVLKLPQRSFIALCGPAGAGKSTFAREFARANGLPSTVIVSSDACRLLLCDDWRTLSQDRVQILQRDTFELFATIVRMRMVLGRPVVADTVNLWPPELVPTAHRLALLALAREHGYRTAIVVFDVALATALARNRDRPEPERVPDSIIQYQRAALDAALDGLAAEGWEDVLVSEDPRSEIVIRLG